MATKEQIYRQQLQELGTYDPAFDPEISTLAQLEREYTRAKKAWSQTAPPGGKPSFLDAHYPVVQRLRAEMLQHREALGLTPRALKKVRGVSADDAPAQKDLITAKLDRIASIVSSYDEIPGAEGALEISDLMDAELKHLVAEDMG